MKQLKNSFLPESKPKTYQNMVMLNAGKNIEQCYLFIERIEPCKVSSKSLTILGKGNAPPCGRAEGSNHILLSGPSMVDRLVNFCTLFQMLIKNILIAAFYPYLSSIEIYTVGRPGICTFSQIKLLFCPTVLLGIVIICANLA